jgi:hypothetical protein
VTERGKQRDRRIRCTDFAGQRQQIIVLTYHDNVVLVAPPGATAVLTCLQVGALRAALRAAILDAAQHG